MSRITLALGMALLAVEAGAAIAILATSDHASNGGGSIGLAVTAGVAFVVAGLIAIARRPENRTGVYLAAVGYLWFAGALSDSDNAWVFSIGFVIGSLAFVPFAALLLSHPTGRFDTRFDAMFPWIVGATLVGLAAAVTLVDATPVQGCPECPRNTLLLHDSPRLADALSTMTTVAGVALASIGVALMVRRWRRAAPALRRTLWPVLVTGGVTLAVLVIDGFVSVLASQDAADAIAPLFFASFAAVPFAFLFGILRTRLARSSVTDVVIALQQGVPIREALAAVLGDPTLEVAYWLDDRNVWVDGDARSVPAPTQSGDRSVTMVDRGGDHVAALVHDAALDDDPEFVSSVAAAAGLSLQNERLNAGLRAQYQLLETITNTAPSLLVNVGTDGRILNQNLAATAAAGVDDEEQVRGRYFWDVFIDPDERPDVVERFEALAPDFAASEYENAFTNARGERLVVYWRAAPVLDEQGRVASIVAGGLDITEREQMAEEKERERAFLNAIANNAPSLICLIDREGRVTERGVNVAFERTLECSDLEVEGRVFWEHWVHSDDADEVRARIEGVIAGETLGEHDNEWVTASGRKLSIAWTCTPLPRIDERTIFLITGLDVTERKRREEDIRAGEERFRAVIESAPVAIVEIGRDGRVKLWNRAAETIFGWSAEDVLDGPPRWIPDDRRQEFRELSAQEAAGHGYANFETVRMHRDGRLLDVEISAAPIRGSTGDVIGAMAVLSDISNRKRQEEELRASRARLVAAGDDARRRLERNLHDGAQQRLVAISVALRLAEAKLAHDPEEAASLVHGSRDELTLALDELRELARGIHPAVLTDRGLRPALEALVGRAPIPVELEAPDERVPPAVEAAAYYVVAEALTNVAKYSRASSVRVRVARRDGALTVTVADDGVGGADPAVGSGLRGLADRVAALDGTLLVESPPGAGTRVQAEIPLPEPPAAEQRRP